MSKKVAPVQWAQRDDRVLLSFIVPDAENVNVEFKNEQIVFTCASHESIYHTTLNLFGGIKVEKCTYKVHGNKVAVCVIKDEVTEGTKTEWDRLTKEPVKTTRHFISVDWFLWKDKDEDPLGGDFDMSQFGGMDGMGDYGNNDETYPEEESLPEETGSEASEDKEGAHEQEIQVEQKDDKSTEEGHKESPITEEKGESSDETKKEGK